MPKKSLLQGNKGEDMSIYTEKSIFDLIKKPNMVEL